MNPKIFNTNNAKIVVLRVDEVEMKIPQNNLNDSILSRKRLVEKEGVNLIMNNYLENYSISYNTNGKPFLREGGFVSISHSNSLIGLGWSFNYNLGLDIEEVNPRIERVESRFIHTEESLYIEGLRDKTIIWTIKESMIKISDDKKLDFRNDIRTIKINDTHWRGVFMKSNCVIDFSIFEFENNIICVNIN